MKYLIIAILLFPCFAFAASGTVGMFQGAVNPYQTMGQGAVQCLTIIVAAPPAPPAAAEPIPAQIISITITWISDEIYAGRMLYG